MFARLSIYENVDLDLADQVKQWVETTETDPFRELPGYSGSMTLVDRDNARLVGIGFYASAGQAQQAETLLTTMFEDARAEVPEPVRPAAGHATRERRALRDRPPRLSSRMCPWCFLTPACPCRRGGTPHAFWLPAARAIVAAVRRLRSRRHA